MTKMEIAFKTIGWFVCLVVIIWLGTGLKGCMEEETRKNKIENAQTAAYNVRFPRIGDKIELDGTEIVIIKRYFWGRKYKVRLPDGRMTDVLGSEIIDKKPIKQVPE